MKYLLLFLICLTFQHASFPQQQLLRTIDANAFSQWLSVEDAAISNDGNYALYKIIHTYNRRLPDSLVVKAIHGNWAIGRLIEGEPRFTDDSRKIVYFGTKDSLCLVAVGSAFTETIPHVASYELFNAEDVSYLAYYLNDSSRKLVLRNLQTGNERSFQDVTKYLISQNGKVMVLIIVSKPGGLETRSLNWVKVLSGDSKIIWKSSKEGVILDNLVLDESAAQLAFKKEDRSDSEIGKSFWLYKKDVDTTVILASDEFTGMDSDFSLDDIQKFSRDGSRLFISLKERSDPKPDLNLAKVDVWTYQDTLLQSEQLNNLRKNEKYRAVISIDDRHIIRLQQTEEIPLDIYGSQSDDFVYMNGCKGNFEERFWSEGSRPSFFIVSSKNGTRRHIPFMVESASPDGHYAIGRNRDGDLFSYEVTTGITTNISTLIPAPANLDIDNKYLHPTKEIYFAGFLANGKRTLLAYDQFDIWLIDLSGKEFPVNLTNGYGRKHQMVFRIAEKLDNNEIPLRDHVILSAFDLNSKANGFYQIDLARQMDPVLSTMGNYAYYAPDNIQDYKLHPLIKAQDANIYIVQRETASQSLNYFWTKDFRAFQPISSVCPEKQYNWPMASLVSFKTTEGKLDKGVLYKPKDFSSGRKYPVIITYYEQKSNNLNSCPSLDGDDENISIPWLVSHGYIVFMPDIHYRMGKAGRCAAQAVLGATEYLSSLPWVDDKHIGLHGHSFGGFETNYIIAHTPGFVAAISSSGTNDAISEYGYLWFNSFSKQNSYENGQQRMGATLWERPDLYIENSPIFRVNKITTPLLIVNNIGDGNVAFEQGLSLFLALRRMGKKAWMLQYDRGGHGMDGKPLMDFLIRSQQFFDYYLKDSPPPRWMAEGIPARMKGIEDGLDLLNEIGPTGKFKTLAPGLLTPGEQMRLEKLKSRKSTIITLN